MNRLIVTSIFVLYHYTIGAQVKRTFVYQDNPVEFLAQNNRMENNFSFPGMKAFIIIGEKSQSLNSIYAADMLRHTPITGIKDYACFYYLTSNHFLSDTAVAGFLNSFIAFCYEKDYIDRNSVHLVWQNNRDTIPCYVFKEVKKIVSSSNILTGNNTFLCDTILTKTVSAETVWQQSRSAKTMVSYTIPGMLEMEEKQSSEHKRIEALSYLKNKGDIFFQLTAGSHNIDSRYKTDFDTTTLVDFKKIKTLWHINTGYYFTNRIYAYLDAGFIYSGKQEKVNGINWNGSSITVNGSGSAGAIIRYGVGLGFLPYHDARFTIFTNLSAGKIQAIAGGGTGTTIIGSGSTAINTIREKETTSYYNISSGTNYHLSTACYLTCNFQYNISRFKEPVGSVKALTGWSLNIGIGITIPTKRSINE